MQHRRPLETADTFDNERDTVSSVANMATTTATTASFHQPYVYALVALSVIPFQENGGSEGLPFLHERKKYKNDEAKNRAAWLIAVGDPPV